MINEPASHPLSRTLSETVRHPPGLVLAPSFSHLACAAATMSEPSEVEKLKAQRREANAAKRAAAGADEDSTAPSETMDTATAPAPPQVDTGALAQIARAEARLDELLHHEIPTTTALIAAAADVEALDAAAKKQVAVAAAVGQLTVMMDECDLGTIEDDEVRSAARVRRKAINKRCALASSGDVEVDGDLAAANAALKKSVVAARAALK